MITYRALQYQCHPPGNWGGGGISSTVPQAWDEYKMELLIIVDHVCTIKQREKNDVSTSAACNLFMYSFLNRSVELLYTTS